MSERRSKTRVGRVISDKMEKTVVVAVQWRQHHPLYGKSMRRVSKFYVHDEEKQCRVGDQVRFVDMRPLSRLKRWRVVEILQRHEVPEIKPSEIGLPEEVEAAPARAETAAQAVAPEEVAAPAVDAGEQALAIETASDAAQEAAVAQQAEAGAPEAPTRRSRTAKRKEPKEEQAG